MIGLVVADSDVPVIRMMNFLSSWCPCVTIARVPLLTVEYQNYVKNYAVFVSVFLPTFYMDFVNAVELMLGLHDSASCHH